MDDNALYYISGGGDDADPKSGDVKSKPKLPGMYFDVE